MRQWGFIRFTACSPFMAETGVPASFLIRLGVTEPLHTRGAPYGFADRCRHAVWYRQGHLHVVVDKLPSDAPRRQTCLFAKPWGAPTHRWHSPEGAWTRCGVQGVANAKGRRIGNRKPVDQDVGCRLHFPRLSARTALCSPIRSGPLPAHGPGTFPHTDPYTSVEVQRDPLRPFSKHPGTRMAIPPAPITDQAVRASSRPPARSQTRFCTRKRSRSESCPAIM
jgi:hypothetical protein